MDVGGRFIDYASEMGSVGIIVEAFGRATQLWRLPKPFGAVDRSVLVALATNS